MSHLSQRRVIDNTFEVAVESSIGMDANAPYDPIAQSRQYMKAIRPDDRSEVQWLVAQRPLKNLVSPAEAFVHGIKTLTSSVDFATFDAYKSRSRRLQRQKVQDRKTTQHKQQRVTPSLAIKAIGDSRKLRVDTKSIGDSDRATSRILAGGSAATTPAGKKRAKRLTDSEFVDKFVAGKDKRRRRNGKTVGTGL